MTFRSSLILILSLLFCVSGCLKKEDPGPLDLGPQASEEDLERVISKALYGIDPWKGLLGQQVIYDFNLRVEAQEEVRPLLRLTQTVMKREEAPHLLKLTVQNHALDLNTGKVEKDEVTTEYATEVQMTAHLPWAKGTLKTMAERPVKRVTYHNLQTEEGSMDPPPLVKAKANCGEVPQCRLRFYKINYDEARWFSDSEYEVQRWMFLISRDAPFLTYILERCLAGIVTLDGRRIYVRQCQFGRDFSYQGAEAPL